MGVEKVLDIAGKISVTEASGCGEFILIYGKDENFIPVEEIIENHELVGQLVSVRYWITSKEVSKEEAVEANVKTLLGEVNGEWHSLCSEATGHMVLEEKLVIGGHDLTEELRAHEGKYLILEITYSE